MQIAWLAASYPLNSENARSFDTCTVYLSCAETALPPKRAAIITISQNGIRVIAHSFASVLHFKFQWRPLGAWSDIGPARLSRQQERRCSRVYERSPLWVKSGHTEKSAPCPLYPSHRCSMHSSVRS